MFLAFIIDKFSNVQQRDVRTSEHGLVFLFFFGLLIPAGFSLFLLFMQSVAGSITERLLKILLVITAGFISLVVLPWVIGRVQYLWTAIRRTDSSATSNTEVNVTE